MTLQTTVTYDTIERTWRAEREGQITGYYPSEALAWAALGVPPAGEQASARQQLIAQVNAYFAAPASPVAPSSAYAAIALILEDLERVPTGAELYELRVKDAVASYLWARAVDWALYQLARGVPVTRRADDDRFSEEYEAARAAALGCLKTIGRDCGAKVSDPDFDSWVFATGVLDADGALPPATDPIGDAYRAGYQAGCTSLDEPPTSPAAPVVRRERYQSEPDNDGSVLTGWSFIAGAGDDAAEFFFPDKHDETHIPVLYAMGAQEINIPALERSYPNLRAVLDSPQVQEARRRWHAGLPIVAQQPA